jgi:hypothetical protein
MGAGCTKADRNRKSAANTAYKAGKRDDVNAKRRQKKHAAQCVGKMLNVPRGTARKARRDACKRANGATSEGFAKVWAIWRKQEARA